MNNKKLFMTLVMAVVLFAAIAISGTVGQSHAFNVSDAKIFVKATGDVEIGSMGENGIPVTLSGESYTNSFTFIQDMYMDGFVFDAETNLNFDTFTLTVSGKTDSSNTISIIVEKGTADDGSRMFEVYGKKGAEESDRLVVNFTPLDEAKTDDADKYILTISYDTESNKFSVNGTVVEMELEFEYEVANMKFANSNKVTEEDADMEMLVKSIANVKGVQKFSTLEGTEVVDFVFWSSLEAPTASEIAEEDKETYHGVETMFLYKETKARVDGSYVFPIYAVSIVGDTVDMEIIKYYTEENEEGEPVEKVETIVSTFAEDSAKTTFKAGKEGTRHEVRLYAANEVHVLFVETIKDETPVEFNLAYLAEYIDKKVPNGRVSTSKSTTFPNLKENGAYLRDFFVFAEEDEGIDESTMSSFIINLGYKKPNSTSDWSWSTNFTVSYDTEGMWAFAYRVKDASGNECETIYEFTREVVDDTPPTVTVTEQLTAYVGQLFKISDPTISDDVSGANTTRTIIKVYKGVRGSEDVEEIKLFEGNSFIPDEITPEGEDYTYYVVYIAFDMNGNSTELKPSYSYITVVEKPNDDKSIGAPDWLTWILAGISLVLLVTIGYAVISTPKEEKEAKKAASSDAKKE